MRTTAVAAALAYPTVEIPSGGAILEAELHVVPDARALVIVASARGYSRHDARHEQLVARLERRRVATLVPDLLTAAEEESDQPTAALRFDIPLLAQRLLAVREWAARNWSTGELPVGYFGTGTGAAAAVVAAAQQPGDTFAVVSAGGRPDLAWDQLPRLRAPALLIVGSGERVVHDLNRQALQRLTCPSRLRVVRGADRRFDGPDALDEMATLASEWFLRYMPVTRT